MGKNYSQKSSRKYASQFFLQRPAEVFNQFSKTAPLWGHAVLFFVHLCNYDVQSFSSQGRENGFEFSLVDGFESNHDG